MPPLWGSVPFSLRFTFVVCPLSLDELRPSCLRSVPFRFFGVCPLFLWRSGTAISAGLETMD
jgi:hypothetical protein